MESIGQGFDRLVQLGPQEVQIGMLKRLRGTPIIRHTLEWQMVYSPTPPSFASTARGQENRVRGVPTRQARHLNG
jgi:hypothetical protein